MAALHSGDLDGIVVALEADLGRVEHAVIARDAFLLAMSPRHPLAAPRPFACAASLTRMAEVLRAAHPTLGVARRMPGRARPTR